MALRHLAPGMPTVRMAVGGEDLNVVPHFLESFEYRGMRNVSWATSIVLFDPSYDYLEQLLVRSGGRVDFYFGWVDGPQSPWSHGQIVSFESSFTDGGLRINLQLASEAVRFGSVKKSRAWIVPTAGGLTYSDVFRTLVTDNMGFKVDESTVTETQALSEDLFQLDQSDAEFITAVLCGRARSIDGIGHYAFWTEGDRAFFKPFDSHEVRRTFTFGSAQESTVLSFTPRFNALQVVQSGGGDLVVTGYDPLSGQEIRAHFDTQSGTQVQRPTDPVLPKARVPTFVNPGVHGATTPNFQQTYRAGRIYHLPYNNDASVESWAGSHWTEIRNQYTTATLVVLGDPKISVSDVVEVIAIKRTDGTPHYTSGRYFVQEVTHVIQHGSFVTNMVLQRPSSDFEPQEVGGIKPNFKPSSDPASGTKDVDAVPEGD